MVASSLRPHPRPPSSDAPVVSYPKGGSKPVATKIGEAGIAGPASAPGSLEKPLPAVRIRVCGYAGFR
jgi:hypothetical protein